MSNITEKYEKVIKNQKINKFDILKAICHKEFKLPDEPYSVLSTH